MRKNCSRLISFILSTLFIVNMCAFTCFSAENSATVWKELYVSPNGNDANNGEESAPFKTIERAKNAVREISDAMQGDIIVNIKGGYYFLEDTLDFGAEDSGKNGYRIYYRGENSNMPVISGGMKVSGFLPSSDNPAIWQARVDNVEQIRQLYVNERKAQRASAGRTVTAVGSYDDPNTIYDSDGLYMSKDYIDIYKNASDIEFQWAKEWVTTICKVDSIIQDPQNQNQVVVKMKQSWWNFMVMDSDGAHGPKPYLEFSINNAMELLDAPGEFYYNRATKLLYYMPQADEDLRSATVIVPRLEKLVRIIGSDVDDKVQNLTFEGLKFAHATWFAPGTDGIKTRQQQAYQETSDVASYLPGTIELNRVNNVMFQGNYFFGFGAAGMDLVNSASNTIVDGNAFSDIGDAAVVVGRDWHGKQHDLPYLTGKPPAVPPSQVNLIDGTQKVATSYYGRTQGGTVAALKNARCDIVQSLIEGYQWLKEDMYTYGSTWHGDPYAWQKDEKSWVRYDFDKAYTISKIRLAFDPAAVSAVQRSGFEVLLSNDKFFTEGNYVRVATQTAPAANFQDYFPDTSGKRFRFLMIRTLGATDFALSNAWAFTPDMDLYTRVEINTNNTISNNYIKRAGSEIAGGGGISGFYTKDLNIVNNEISDITYSGIALGWGWGGELWNYGSSGNKILNNYISNTNLSLLDGAGIYTLGDQPGMVVSGNYVDSPFQGNGAFYPDNGTNRSVWTDNVCEDALVTYLINGGTNNNVIKNLYTTHDLMINNAGEASNSLEAPKIYLPGNPLPNAYVIIKNAGLKDEYKHIRSWVYDVKPNLPDETQRYSDLIRLNYLPRSITALKQVSDNILKNGTFGGLPGQYPIEYKYKLLNAINALDSAGGNAKLDRFIELRHLLVEIGKSVQHQELESMVAFCEEKLKSANVAEYVANVSCVPCAKLLRTAASSQMWGIYPVSAPQVFSEKLAEVKNKMSGVLTDAEKYELVLDLEKAYQKFELSRSSADIDYINIEDALNVEINKADKEVIAEFPITSDLKDKKISIVPYGAAQLGTAAKTVDLNNQFTIPIYCPAINKFAMWKLKGIYDVAPKIATFNTDGWTTKSGKANSIIRAADGALVLTANRLPYMNTNISDVGKTFDISFMPVAPNAKKQFGIIFAAQSGEQFSLDGDKLKDNRYEIGISDNTATLYSVNLGVRNTIVTRQISVKYNDNNIMKFLITKEGKKNRLQVWLNNEQVFNDFTDLIIPSGHLGFYSETIGIKIINNH